MTGIDLRSDTVTRPSPAMRRAMAEAEVGDDVWGDDPSVNRLQRVAAELLGFEAALFVPSGTMGNQIAVRCHTRPGDRIILESQAHIFKYEAGGPAVLSGVIPGFVDAARGIMEPRQVEAAIPPVDDHFAPATLLCVENTSNRGGGSVYPLSTLRALLDLAARRGLATHLDGARIFNAQVALGVPAAEIARGFDSLTFCLSKGLGAPVGSLLCGSAAWIAGARRVRKMLGGGMRQSGILAAAGLYALRHNVARLGDDHRRATRLARGLAASGWRVDEPETNMVYVRAAGAAELVERLSAQGVLVGAVGPDRLRLVTHLDVDDEGIQAVVRVFSRLHST